ncbi:hypothetical protein Glove_350g141 [Diversispora epigaea]|uniref:Protein kinase domain-containing protein n=1 Tax=Diversispora epigaea TaxID=1348612 RepID=A0A397HD87_9GLOM|nr:hypothetical protein Glove_350g141 [Diversispora epigaea]
MSQSKKRKTNNNITVNNNSRTEYDDIPFYHYSKFENVKMINKNVKNVYKAHIKKIVSQQEKPVVEVVALKYISLNNFINEVKRHRKLEINDSILKFYGITNQENTNNYLIVLEYANNGSLRQYLRTNFQKFDWNIKLNLAKQIANALMNLHDNNIIHGKLTSDSILVHNGTIKLNDFGLKYLKSLSVTITIPIQYTDFRYLELFNKSLDIYSLGIILWEISNDGIFPFEEELITKSSLSSPTNNNIIDLINDIIIKLKREKSIPGIPPKYKEIYTDCLKRHGNSRPDIFEVVNDLSEINTISEANNLEKSNEEIQFNHPSINSSQEMRPITIKNYVREHNLNSVKILHKMIRYSSNYWFTSLIGFFYQYEELITKSSLSSPTNNNIIDLINDIIIKLKREKSIPGIPPKYKEIYTDCLKRHGNSRPDIFEVVNDLSEINTISEANNLEKSNEEIQFNHPSINSVTKTNNYNIIIIKKLFEFFINIFKIQSQEMRPITIKNYVREHNLNSVKILHKMIRYSSNYWFTSLIGFFYQYGIGTVIDNQMAFKFFNLAANERLYMKNISSNLSLRKFYDINKKIGIILIAYMYFDGIGVKKDPKKSFQICSKVADEGSTTALNSMAYCYYNGLGVEKNEEKAFELYLKSTKKGNIVAQYNVGDCYKYGTGIAKDEVKGFQLQLKSALAGNLDATNNTGYCYQNGIGVDIDKKEAFKWYFKDAEKGDPMAQDNLGYCYENGEGIEEDRIKAFEWYKKSAENKYANSQYMVGKYFYEGRGTGKDIVKAIYWLNEAKENRNINASRLLDEISLDD